ncbi:PREDICTED: dehydrodolichyl diphosphate synthase 6-like isoform 2 [Fragaria vesca subsp. vesca]
MENSAGNRANQMFWSIVSFFRRCLFLVISARPIPHHIAFIMDGNRRYAKKRKLMEGTGHREKIEGLIKEESIVNRYGVKVHFIGNIKLLSEPVRLAAERAMVATSNNSKGVLSICVAYTSTDEIMHAVQESCEEKWNEISVLNASGAGYDLDKFGENENEGRENIVQLTDIERHMYMAVAPDPDILIRTSGETRLSNFLLWQSAYCCLYTPSVLWPEIGFRHFVWAILNFQCNRLYLERKKKQS